MLAKFVFVLPCAPFATTVLAARAGSQSSDVSSGCGWFQPAPAAAAAGRSFAQRKQKRDTICQRFLPNLACKEREGRVWAQVWLIVVSSLRSNLEPSNQRQSAIASFIFQETHHQEGTTQHAAEAKWLSALFLRALAGFFYYYYFPIPVLRYRGFAFRISRQQQQHRHHGGTGYKLQRATQEGARLAWASNKTKNPNRRVARSLGRSQKRRKKAASAVVLKKLTIIIARTGERVLSRFWPCLKEEWCSGG